MIGRKIRSQRRSIAIFPLLFALIATNACLLKSSKPNLPRIFPSAQSAKQTGKPPIIIIPGITGSELVNQKTGVKLWPELFPKDKEALALPISSTTLSENNDEVAALLAISVATVVRHWKFARAWLHRRL